MVEAIHKYYETNGHEKGSLLTKTRYRFNRPFCDDADLARSEVVSGLAILANSAPAAFWVIYHTFSDAALLEKVRTQIESITSIEPSTANQPERRSFSIRKLKDVPILYSLIQETLRYRARGTGPRFVMEDVTISDQQNQYHLEEGSVVMLAHHAMHTNRDAWGDTADEFIAERFLPGNKIPTNAFRGFGGGANMCPGKSFALAEIAALLSVLATRFDLYPVDGRWEDPGQDLSNMARENPPTLRKTMVEVVPRKSMEGVVWTLDF